MYMQVSFDSIFVFVFLFFEQRNKNYIISCCRFYEPMRDRQRAIQEQSIPFDLRAQAISASGALSLNCFLEQIFHELSIAQKQQNTFEMGSGRRSKAKPSHSLLPTSVSSSQKSLEMATTYFPSQFLYQCFSILRFLKNATEKKKVLLNFSFSVILRFFFSLNLRHSSTMTPLVVGIQSIVTCF
jgi:hypothetical protein